MKRLQGAENDMNCVSAVPSLFSKSFFYSPPCTNKATGSRASGKQKKKKNICCDGKVFFFFPFPYFHSQIAPNKKINKWKSFDRVGENVFYSTALPERWCTLLLLLSHVKEAPISAGYWCWRDSLMRSLQRRMERGSFSRFHGSSSGI